MHDFIYNALPGKVVFGCGKLASVKEEVAAMNSGKALVLCTPEQRELAEQVSDLLGELSAGVYDKAVMHVPIETAHAGGDEASRVKAGCTVAVGGGSTIGLAKAIALHQGLPILAIPTTYAGSEMTPVWGITKDGIKTTGRDQNVLPETVIYDPELVTSLPGFITGPSGLNAIAHCVEALYAENANPIISMLAEEGIRAIARSLETAVNEPENLDARSDTLYGAWLAGASLGAVGMSLHHKLCHTLGGSFNLPHAEVHSIVIAYATAYNTPNAQDAIQRVARAMGCDKPEDAPKALHQLVKAVCNKTSLKELGMTEEDLDKAADIAASNPYYNPRPVTREGMRALLGDAFDGREPSVA
ncbi:Maleylacetate reductase [Candidatus Terasakiella magnetica]|uniref:Maleylacetate reductase n=1 Tax=Candidatus Terasakiella magnetica TaxID=1867952 RepID=A0A1C3RFJ4_9PROT|nr:maleylacetate reductase [Candidatus Terasakiella magnetica]SCA56028.1 Maleylacetate reductase [Candidatus Terasakiella magnetica]